MTPASLLAAVQEAADVAGRVALAHFRGGLSVRRKGDGSPVTNADVEAETAVREWISTRFPQDGIVGEELGSLSTGASRRWYLDPIDGTRSFIHGVPFWGSMVAVQVDGVIVAGAINCPAVGEHVAAAIGEGCWLNGVRCRVSSVASLSTATVLATDERFVSHPGRVAPWLDLGRQVETVRTWGDCYGYLLVAAGRAELMVDDRLSPWDAAALVPIVSEAGGVFSDWHGRISGLGEDGIATNAALASTFRSILGVPAERSAP